MHKKLVMMLGLLSASCSLFSSDIVNISCESFNFTDNQKAYFSEQAKKLSDLNLPKDQDSLCLVFQTFIKYRQSNDIAIIIPTVLSKMVVGKWDRDTFILNRNYDENHQAQDIYTKYFNTTVFNPNAYESLQELLSVSSTTWVVAEIAKIE